jgi:HlyD family secretion protein/epimerase transport system membrane fusion protein
MSLSPVAKPSTETRPALVEKLSTALAVREDKLPPIDSLGDVRKPLIVGGLIVAIAFVGCGLWAALAPLGTAAIAPGVIVVESGRRTIQHLEGGIVKQILVDDGSVVKAGDVLLRLDDTRTKAQDDILQADQDLSTATRARLVAERDGLKEPRFPTDLLDRRGDPRVAAMIAGQIGIFNTRRAALSGQHDILDQRIGQYREQITGLQAQVTAQVEQIRLIRDELHDLGGLLTQGLTTKTRVLALQRELARLEGERGDHIAAIARAQQGIGETRMQMFQLDKQRQEEVAKELHDVEARLTETGEKLVAARDQLRRVDVISPIDGSVMNLQVHTVGGVISPGQPLMEVIPTGDQLVIEAQVSPLDVDSIHVGDEVAIRVATVDARMTPVIYGKLEMVSADRLVDPKGGNSFYKARITIAPEQAARLDGVELHSGMLVTALINIGEQSALHYAFKPLLENMARAFHEK